MLWMDVLYAEQERGDGRKDDMPVIIDKYDRNVLVEGILEVSNAIRTRYGRKERF